MEITREAIKSIFNEYTNNPNEATKNAYIEINQKFEQQENNKKLEVFKTKIKGTNKYYEFMNTFEAQVCEVLNNYTDSFSTVNGVIRQSLLSLLPKDERVRYSITNVGGRLQMFYYVKGFEQQNNIFYDFDGVFTAQKYVLLNFNKELKKAQKYLKIYQKLQKELDEVKPNYLFKEFIKENNHISKIYF